MLLSAIKRLTINLHLFKVSETKMYRNVTFITTYQDFYYYLDQQAYFYSTNRQPKYLVRTTVTITLYYHRDL